MKEDQLTPWFPAEVKPVRIGFYQTMFGSTLSEGYSFWDGKNWWCQYKGLDRAIFWGSRDGKGDQTKIWRGLRSKS